MLTFRSSPFGLLASGFERTGRANRLLGGVRTVFCLAAKQYLSGNERQINLICAVETQLPKMANRNADDIGSQVAVIQ